LDELVQLFVEVSDRQGEALLDDDTRRYSRLFVRNLAIDNELRAGGPGARLALKRPFTHPNPQVRFEAATAIVALVPDDARAVLRRIQESREQPFALHRHGAFQAE
jgi:hypothetical protein